jgi:hypothetical protein
VVGRFDTQMPEDRPVVLVVAGDGAGVAKEGVTDGDGRRDVVGCKRRYRRGQDLFEVGAGIPPPTDRPDQDPAGVEQHRSRLASHSHIAEPMRPPEPRGTGRR